MSKIGAQSTTLAAASGAIHAGPSAVLAQRRTSIATGTATNAGRTESVSFTAKRMQESSSLPEIHHAACANAA